MSRVLTGTLSLLLWAAAARPQGPPTVTLPSPSAHGKTGFVFEDATAAAGLNRFRHVGGSPEKPYLPETLGSGVALFDFDNDGWIDIYLVNALPQFSLADHAAAPRSALFRNNRDGSFLDVTAKAGLENRRWGVGVCAGDIDNDGWQDLYVTNMGQSRLYRNHGDGSFSDIAAAAGVQVDGWATGCAFGDYNRDGLLDLYVARYVDFDWRNPPPAGGSGAAPAAAPDGRASAQKPSMGAAYDPGQSACFYFGVSVACGPKGLKPMPDVLFLNKGGGKFQNVTNLAKVDRRSPRYGLSVGWVDVDDDGRLDIVVANDSQPNFLFHNEGDGTFQEIGLLSGLGTNGDGHEQAYMGMAVGDYDRDGKSDFFFTTFSGDNYTLHRNRGKLDFSDATLRAGLAAITMPFLGWGTAFLDYDNDGWLDIFAANGHIFSQAGPSWGTSYAQRPLLFRNLGNGSFADVSGNMHQSFGKPRSSRGAAAADLFNDGTLDVVVNNLDGEPTLFRNRGPESARWISIKLVGDPGRKTPRDAIGSTVYCATGDVRQRGEVASGRGYISQSDHRVHFGLGEAKQVDRLEIRWSNGQVERLENLPVNQFLTIEQGKGIQTPPRAAN